MREAPSNFLMRVWQKYKMTQIDSGNKNNKLRKKLKEKRKILSSISVANSSILISQKIWQLPELQRAKNIGCYIGVNGEASCTEFIKNAYTRKKRIFVPVLRKNEMKFYRLFPESELQNNQFGIPEPIPTEKSLIPTQNLSVILVPLLAFDPSGNRLGMGGGYYDKLLSFTKRRDKFRRPLLIGMAYDFQRVDEMIVNDWDIPMHIIITESQSYRFI
jgi:5-formyltetrahydrofolate cyclo-ligase